MLSAVTVDVFSSLSRFPLAILLGWRDTISAHRRSFIGPIWIFLQTFLWVFFIGILFGKMLGSSSAIDYLIYVAIGMVAFNLMTLIIAESANGFIRDASLIKNIPIPPSIYILRVGTRAVFTLLFELPVILLAMSFKGYLPSLAGVGLSIIGLIITIWAFMGMAFGLASLGARFRDLIPAISVGNRLAFFATPIFWLREATDPVREFLSVYNPLSYYMKIIRAPLMDLQITSNDWMMCIGIGVVMWVFGLVVFGFTRDKLAALV